MTSDKKLDNPGAWVEAIIKGFIENSPENSLKNQENDKAFESPLVGFSRGDDPLYDEYKDHVGPFYLTPWEIFAITYRDSGVKPEELTVISSYHAGDCCKFV